MEQHLFMLVNTAFDYLVTALVGPLLVLLLLLNFGPKISEMVVTSWMGELIFYTAQTNPNQILSEESSSSTTNRRKSKNKPSVDYSMVLLKMKNFPHLFWDKFSKSPISREIVYVVSSISVAVLAVLMSYVPHVAVLFKGPASLIACLGATYTSIKALWDLSNAQAAEEQNYSRIVGFFSAILIGFVLQYQLFVEGFWFWAIPHNHTTKLFIISLATIVIVLIAPPLVQSGRLFGLTLFGFARCIIVDLPQTAIEKVEDFFSFSRLGLVIRWSVLFLFLLSISLFTVPVVSTLVKDREDANFNSYGHTGVVAPDVGPIPHIEEKQSDIHIGDMFNKPNIHADAENDPEAVKKEEVVWREIVKTQYYDFGFSDFLLFRTGLICVLVFVFIIHCRAFLQAFLNNRAYSLGFYVDSIQTKTSEMLSVIKRHTEATFQSMLALVVGEISTLSLFLSFVLLTVVVSQYTGTGQVAVYGNGLWNDWVQYVARLLLTYFSTVSVMCVLAVVITRLFGVILVFYNSD